jgi:hypothetical protein
LAFPFDDLPFCTKSLEEAMRLADHCHPFPGNKVAARWADIPI